MSAVSDYEIKCPKCRYKWSIDIDTSLDALLKERVLGLVVRCPRCKKEFGHRVFVPEDKR